MRKVLLLVFVLLLACRKTDVPTHEDYHTGTEGLVIKFLDDKTKIQNGEYLHLNVEVSNNGAYTPRYAKLVASGYDKTMIDIDPVFPLGNIEGKSASYPYPSSEYVEFPEVVPVKLANGDSFETSLKVSACYDYKTTAGPAVCIIPDLQTWSEGKSVCEPNTITLTDQGAPIAVTEVEQYTKEYEMEYRITIENVGDGKIIKNYEKCPFESVTDEGEILYDIAINGLGDPKCTPEKVKLYQGKGTLVCTFTTRNKIVDSYITPLKIILSYYYGNSIGRQMTIVNPIYNGDDNDVDDSQKDEPVPDKPVSDEPVPDKPVSDDPVYVTSPCPCNAATLKDWGGCICIEVNGVNIICSKDGPIIVHKERLTDGMFDAVIKGTEDYNGRSVVDCGYSYENINGPTNYQECPASVSLDANQNTIYLYGKFDNLYNNAKEGKGEIVTEICEVNII